MMIFAVGKKADDWFTSGELLNFPCTDLRTIDGLWVKYSQGKFGFSVQKKIYVECGAKLDGKYPGHKIWFEFCDRVGWVEGSGSVSYGHLKANASLSPAGKFPAGRVGFWGGGPVGGVGFGWCGVFGLSQAVGQGCDALFSRIETCEL